MWVAIVQVDRIKNARFFSYNYILQGHLFKGNKEHVHSLTTEFDSI